MTIAIVATAEALPQIQKSFETQHCVGVTFEYYSDINEILSSLETRGFYLDKLVVIASFLQSFEPAARQAVVQRILQICGHLQPTSEIYIADSKQILRSEYANALSVYPQVKYQSQQLHVSELFGVIMGDIKQDVAENIDESVKPKGFFSRHFGKRKPSTQLQPQEDAALFADVPAPQPESQTPSVTQEADDLDNLFEEPPVTPVATPQPEIPSVGIDLPLFEAEPAPTSTPTHTPTPTPTPMPEPLQSSAPTLTPNSQKQQPWMFGEQSLVENEGKCEDEDEDDYENESNLFVAPMSAPQTQPVSKIKAPKVKAPKVKKAKNNYVSIFQKRTKIILCTGDRRTGISTTASNMAQQAVNDGLSVLVMDLDFERKGQSINFPFQADENDTQIAFSLFRATSAPSNLSNYVIHLEDGLDFLGTAISVSEVTNIHKAVTDDILKQILAAALADYDLIFVDCPFEYLKEYSSLVSMAHIIIHSMMTDYRSILNTINQLTPDDFENDMTYNLYMTKVMLLLNNYTPHYWNSTEINESTVLNYMCTLTEEDIYQGLDVAGRIPALPDYDTLMDSGALLVSKKSYQSLYIQLLNTIATRG